MFLAGLCLAVVGSPGQAKEKVTTLPPISEWLVDYDQTSCVLARRFGYEGKPILLSMRTYGPGRDFDVTLAGEIAARLQHASNFGIAYGSSPLSTIQLHQNARAGTYGPAVVFSSRLIPPKTATKNAQQGDVQPSIMPDAAFEASIDSLTLATSHQRFVLNTGSLVPALNALQRCTDALLERWGLDPVVQARLSRRPKVADTGWVKEMMDGFPDELTYQGSDGRLQLRIMVSKEGLPTQCETVQTFRNVKFKISACDTILKNGRFEPALDEHGQQTETYYFAFITYGD